MVEDGFAGIDVLADHDEPDVRSHRRMPLDTY